MLSTRSLFCLVRVVWERVHSLLILLMAWPPMKIHRYVCGEREREREREEGGGEEI